MIFNSISKELSTQKSHHNTFKPAEYKSNSYINRDYFKHSNYHKDPQYQMPEKESALSQMNQKITNQLQYLQYKDYQRQKDLQSSRLSNSSQHSFRSNKSRHSNLSSSRASLQSPLKNNHIRTTANEHYFPQIIKSKLQNKPWQAQISNHYQNFKTSQTPLQRQEYRQFLRKPITIENYALKYGLNHKKQENFENKQLREIKSNTNNSYRSKTQEFQSRKEENQLYNQTFSSPINKDFVTSLGNDSKINKKVKIVAQMDTSQEKQSSQFSAVKSNAEKENQKVLSPLEMSNSKNKGIVIAAVLIGLGLLLFILQVTK